MLGTTRTQALCGRQDKAGLLALLEKEPFANIFLLADIELFGFDKPFQKVWRTGGASDGASAADAAVYLLFYDNLSVWAQNPGGADADFVAALAKDHPVNCVMGKAEVVAPLAGALPGYTPGEKLLCALPQGTAPAPPVWDESQHGPHPTVQTATPADVDDIFAFLASVPELRGLYTSKQMIADRIQNGSGIHLIIRQGGSIVAHGNTAASFSSSAAGGPGATMIGGLGAAGGSGPDARQEPRREALAQAVAFALCQTITKSGKAPCTLCTQANQQALFAPLGFQPVCNWLTLTRA